MKRNIVVAVLVAVLLCPLIVDAGSSETDADGNVIIATTMLVFDELKINVVDYNNQSLHSGDTIQQGDLICINPVMNNVKILMNDEILNTIGVLFAVQERFFEKDTLTIEAFNYCSILFELQDNNCGLEIPEKIEGISIKDQIILPDIVQDEVKVKEWAVVRDNNTHTFLPGKFIIDRDFMNLYLDGSTNMILTGMLEYTEYEISLMIKDGTIDDKKWTFTGNKNYICNYSKNSDDVVLPSIDSHWYEFINWEDEEGTPHTVINSNECRNVILYANQKLKDFNVNFYDNKDATAPFESMLLTKDNFQTPMMSESFAGWFYDNQGTESKFEEGVILQDDMNVYARYYETPKEPEAPTYNVRFLDKGSLLAEKKLSDDNFEVPHIDSENFLGWYYYDDQNIENKFEKGVLLKDGMEVYSKYSEVSVPKEDNVDDSGSKDAGFYSMLTENGISITDNETLESIIASSIFVVLALATFLFFFRRH